MSAARKPTARPRRLALVRGGLDDSHTGGGDGDWEDFCRRIGWQSPTPEPDGDFERRLQEGLLAMPITPDNAVEIEGARSNSGVRLRPWLEEAEEALPEYRQLWSPEYAQLGNPEYGQSVPRATSGDRSRATSGDRSRATSGDRSRATSGDRSRATSDDRSYAAPGDRSCAAIDMEAAVADFGADGAAEGPRDVRESVPHRRWVRVGVAAAALAVAAAAALAVTRLATSDMDSKAASIAAPSTDGTHKTAPHAEDRAISDGLAVEGHRQEGPLPLDTGPLRATPDNRPRAPIAPAPTANPAPSPESPPIEPSAPPDTRPEPPGMRVAQLSPDEESTESTVTAERATPDNRPHPWGRGPREEGLARWESSPAEAREPFAADARHPAIVPARPVLASVDGAPRPAAGTFADPAALRAAAVRSLVARPAVVTAQRPAVAPAREPLPEVTLASVDSGAAPAAGDAAGDAWPKVPAATRPGAAEGAGSANASWSLAGAKDRWVGASLAAPPPPLATSNIGVIVQLDLGKALGKL